MEFQLEHPNGLVPVIAVVIDEEVIATLQLPLDLTAALLSGAEIVGFYREGKTTHVNSGIAYKNKEFVFPENWVTVDGVPTPPEILEVSK